MTRSLSRRTWLRQAGSLLLPGMGPLALQLAAAGPAAAATGSGYKALVCVFLYGGNDAYNTVLATDAASWSAYEAARADGADPLRLAPPGTPAQPGATATHARLGGVLPITPRTPLPGRPLALHPALGRVQSLFQDGRLAIVANVGALAQPLTKADWLGGRGLRPPKLFSHNDQQCFWQAFGSEGSTAGWGGHFIDPTLGLNTQPGLAAISVHGRAVWGVGQQARPYQLDPTGSVRLAGGANGTLLGSAAAQQALLAVVRGGRSTHVLEADHAAIAARSVQTESLLSAALPALGAGPWSSAGATDPGTDPLLRFVDPLSGSTSFNPLAAELQAVARSIAARQTLGMARQVFFVGLGGWDTHDAQPTRHTRLLAQLGHALGYFDQVLGQLGVAEQVTTFTASDFGRSLSSNGDGSDHGWGGHHFVMGGAVRGGEVYGTLPLYGRADGAGGFDSPDQLQGGVLLPSTGLPAYAATLGRWFGLGDAELAAALPGLTRWSVGARQLGFLG